jgi:hypothetical protein
MAKHFLQFSILQKSCQHCPILEFGSSLLSHNISHYHSGHEYNQVGSQEYASLILNLVAEMLFQINALMIFGFDRNKKYKWGLTIN